MNFKNLKIKIIANKELLSCSMLFMFTYFLKSQFTQSNKLSNPFSIFFLNQIIFFVIAFLKQTKIEKKTISFSTFKDLSTVFYSLIFSTVIIITFILSFTLKNYYNKILLTSLKIFDIPVVNIKKNNISIVLSDLLHYLLICFIASTSISKFSLFGILIFILYTGFLSVKSIFKVRNSKVYNSNTDIVLKTTCLVLSYILFLGLGNVNDIWKIENVIKAILKASSSYLVSNIISIVNDEFSYNKNITVNTQFMIKGFKIINNLITFKDIKTHQICVLICLLAIFYYKNKSKAKYIKN